MSYREWIEALHLHTLEERRVRGCPDYKIKFLKQTDDMGSEQFFKRCRDRATKGYDTKSMQETHQKIRKEFLQYKSGGGE